MGEAAQDTRHAALDRRLVEATRGIRLLGSLSWPASVQRRFLADWAAGRARLPEVAYPRFDFAATRAELAAIAAAADRSHPVGDYIARSASSWRIATALIDAAGTPAITTHSSALYGRPGDPLPGATQTSLDAARHFIAIADEFHAGSLADEPVAPLDADAVAAGLQQDVDGLFGIGIVRVESDPELIAKAAAGATRIRLRAGTSFTAYDRRQLLEHEAFVHTLTALNGRAQPLLKSLARASPRSTATQEGLAVFAELMSGSIDIARMRRISLRILAIQQALDGADFLQVFRFFLDAGQNETDSFASAMRVFRGAPLGGGAAFTKDAVYLHGLLSIHTFFRWALRHQRMALCDYLFAGKLALRDVLALEPCFADGQLAPPLYRPPWLHQARGLAGTLAFSLFANRIRLERVQAEDLLLAL